MKNGKTKKEKRMKNWRKRKKERKESFIKWIGRGEKVDKQQKIKQIFQRKTSESVIWKSKKIIM